MQARPAQKATADRYPSRIAAEPRWQEREDPVVYRDDLHNAPIAAELLEGYARDGYLILPSLFSPEEVQVLRDELNRMRHDPAVLASEKAIKEPESQSVRSVFAIHQDNALLARVVRDERIASTARFILGGEAYVHQSRTNFKPGFAGKEFYWHSDFETWHSEDGMPRMRALSCSILLSDNDSHNGPLLLMPGSHRHFVSCVGETPENHYQQSLRRQQFGVPDDRSLTALAKQYGIDSVLAPAGSVVFFDCNTMHGSNSNISPDARSNLFFVYNQTDNAMQEPYGGRAPRPAFIAEREDFSALAIQPQRYA